MTPKMEGNKTAGWKSYSEEGSSFFFAFVYFNDAIVIEYSKYQVIIFCCVAKYFFLILVGVLTLD